jgi:hypothetical protein
MEFLPSGGSEIVLLNPAPPAIALPAGLRYIEGDGRDMRTVSDSAFDVAFSNSVIEHVGGRIEQQRMAREIQRVAPRFYVQTPNLYFPLEPHFLLPCIQFLPIRIRAEVVYRLRPGWYGGSVRDRAEAMAVVESIQLLTRREFGQLFSNATIHVERLWGFPKSFVAVGGWHGGAYSEPAGRAHE